jgi:hypothetical protein
MGMIDDFTNRDNVTLIRGKEADPGRFEKRLIEK